MNNNELVLGAIIAALTVIGAQLSIFVGEVPLTFQLVGVALAGMALRPRVAFMSMLAYMALGLVGVPVFAGFRGGVGIVLGPTGGFILSMPVAAVAVSLVSTCSCLPEGRWGRILAGMVTIPIMYLFGSLQMAWVLNWRWTVAIIYTLQFLIFDILKVLLAATMARLMARMLPR